MKRIGRILSLVMILFVLTSVCAFADGESLKLLDTYPKEGSTGAAIENFGIKLYFDSPMTGEILGKTNDNLITLKDENGTQIPIRILYAPKEDGVVMVLYDNPTATQAQATGKKNKDKSNANVTMITSDTEYTLWISKDFKDDAGKTLGEDKTISFKTLNQKRNTRVNMLLMLVLYGGIIVVMMKKPKKDDDGDGKKQEAVNPYKEAKKTGKSVKEIVEKEQERKRKEELKQKKKEALYAEAYEEVEEYIEEGHYRVKSRRTVASAGSTYITGRKAIAEAKAARKAQEEIWAQKAKKGKKGKKK